MKFMIIRETEEYLVDKNDREKIEDGIYVETDGLVIAIHKK